MIKPVTIEKNDQSNPLDFTSLREHGIEMLQRMCGDIWTDYNLHDPGVTILEQLCFAITDLAYRTGFALPDLLADKEGIIDHQRNSFFSREQILTTNPVTINDFRKIIIDEVPEVDNVWLYPLSTPFVKNSIKGLYKIVVQVKREIAAEIVHDKERELHIANLVRQCFIDKRNLCEDIAQDVVILKPVKITVEADIHISKQLIPEETLAKIYHQIESSINQSVKYYSESELLKRGYAVEDIYSGPMLKKGFIPDSELKDKTRIIDPVELSKNISQINGILSVKKLVINGGDNNRYNKPFVIAPSTFLLFDIQGSEPLIKLYTDNHEVPIRNSVFRAVLQKIRESSDRSFIASIYKRLNTAAEGKYRNPGRYYSIQNLFPHIYGIGEEGLLESEPASRKAQARQLKGYLMFFEQILANYLAQLANIQDVFSNELNAGSQTYFSQPLYDIPGAEYLIKAFTDYKQNNPQGNWDDFKNNKDNAYEKALNNALETDESKTHRKNVMFNHLLARFNEFTVSYPVELFRTLYVIGTDTHGGMEELEWKSDMLKNIAELGYNRARAFNYLKQDDGQRHDFEWKMNKLLYIRTSGSRKRFSEALNSDKLRFEKPKKNQQQSFKATGYTGEETYWIGEIPKIILSRKEVDDLIGSGHVSDPDDQPGSLYSFKNQEITILKHALDIKNYRIGPDLLEDSFMLMYKPPQGKVWQVIGRRPTDMDAMLAVKDLIKFLTEVNMRSEGFYLVEHILLRPKPDENVFGFKFYKSEHEVILNHKEFTSFYHRNDRIADLMAAATKDRDKTFNVSNYAKTAYGADKDEHIRALLQQCTESTNRLYPCFRGVVRVTDHLSVNENFFNFRMSVVLPSWSARFQDSSFREHTEKLFRLHIPAHINPQFIWLGIDDMKRFEPLHDSWLDLLAGAEGADAQAKVKLIEFLTAGGKATGK